MKDSKWVAVKPNPEALIVNIGDLFQVKVSYNVS
jgi:gibberellin 2-oxidase